MKTALREIRRSFGRFVSITCIIALGVGFFAGLKIVLRDMTLTADGYYSEHSFYDYKLMCSYGYDVSSVTAASQNRNVTAAEGAYSQDALFTVGGNDSVMKVCSQTESVNTLSLKYGRLAENAGECVADARYFDESALGSVMKLSDSNDSDTLDKFKNREFTVVGVADSPVYLNYERGTTKLGGGALSGFIYTVPDSFCSEYYTEIYLTLNSKGRIYSDEYKSYIDSVEPEIEALGEQLANARFNSVKNSALDEYNDNYAEYERNLKKYNEEKADTQSKLDSAKNELDESERALRESRAEYESGLVEYESGTAQLKNGKEQLENGLERINVGISQAQSGKEQLEKSLAALEQITAPDEQTAAQITALNAQLDSAKKTLEGLNQQKLDLLSQQAELKASEQQLAESKEKLDSAKAKIESGEAQLESGRAEYNSQSEKAQQEFADAERELNDAKQKLSDARAEIDSLDKAESYVLGRDKNTGYVCFENDSAIVDGIAAVFPLFFFLVAALMCMTTMTRMVEEQRTDIGTMKALGYSKYTILSKYVIYSGLAGIIGTLIGFFGFSVLFPKVIWAAYSVMYNFAPIEITFDWLTGFILLLVALVCTVGTTVASSIGTLNESAAQIMRPKAPKSGKHLVIEKFRLFQRLKFLQKVSVRNMIRYRRRFFMMVLGISGCTALLVTGFGVRDSVQQLPDYQFGTIQIFDYSIMFDNEADKHVRGEITSVDGLDECVFLHSMTYDVLTDGGAHSAVVVAPEDGALTDFVNLVNNGRQVEYPSDGQAVVSRKFAEKYDLSAGSEITVCDSDGKRCVLTVSDICENYVDTYVYTTLDSLADGFGYTPEINAAYANKTDSADLHAVSAKLLSTDGVTNVSVCADVGDRVTKMLVSMDYIVLLIIACAAALAFVVLYNLTNINITERLREIATIKVLGFYQGETASYVFGENFVLTGLGALLGLLLGKLLHAFVMAQIDIDKVSFNVRVDAFSYIYSILLTFAFAVAVDLVMTRKLGKIDMAQSLKSVE